MPRKKKKKQNSYLYYGIVIAVSLLVIILVLSFGQNYSQIPGINFESFHGAQKVRKASAAGSFYPLDVEELKETIRASLNQATLKPAQGEIQALILPHASYEFSGEVAAFGFKQLINKNIDTVIIIGNSHHENFPGISIFPQGYFETPLGKVEINSELAEKIMAENDRIIFRESTHQDEHSIEVQLPFLQMVLENFKIVPILFGNGMKTDWQVLSQAILKNIKGENVLIIASSDLSHYPSLEDAMIADGKTVENILTGKVEDLEVGIKELESKKIVNLSTIACGLDSIKTVMTIEKELGGTEIKLLKYTNSGQATGGDESRVVGYAAIGFFGDRRGSLLNQDEQEKLLRVAKQSVEYFVKSGKTPEFNIKENILNEKKGAFVTLKNEKGLRGCIGNVLPTELSLYQIVSEMAIAAASQDSRFDPVTKEELPKLEYEISVLSEPERINSLKDIELGKHGVVISNGKSSGVFLPQVAFENNWDLEKFLAELCSQKAGLSQNCWQSKSTEISIFTAQVF